MTREELITSIIESQVRTGLPDRKQVVGAVRRVQQWNTNRKTNQRLKKLEKK